MSVTWRARAEVDGRQTGFCFETDGRLEETGYFAEFGEQANGVYLN